LSGSVPVYQGRGCGFTRKKGILRDRPQPERKNGAGLVLRGRKEDRGRLIIGDEEEHDKGA